jgi:phosphohistidine phosphatase SixA
MFVSKKKYKTLEESKYELLKKYNEIEKESLKKSIQVEGLEKQLQKTQSTDEKTSDLEHIFVVRHGDYESSGCLSMKGIKQIYEACKTISKYIDYDFDSVKIFSSEEKRALETAEIIGSYMGVKDIETNEYLYDSRRSYPIYPIIKELLKKNNTSAKTIILTTHLEIIRGFPKYMGGGTITTTDKGGIGYIDYTKITK